MIRFKQADSSRVSHFSPWLLGTAGLLLALIIAVFAVNNYRREKVVMKKVLEQEGLAILNITSSAARGALGELVSKGEFDPETWQDAIQGVIVHASEHKQVAALFLVDDNGKILAHTEQEKRFASIDQSQLQLLEQNALQLPSKKENILFEKESGIEVFQIAIPFQPFRMRNERMMMGRDGGMRHGMRRIGPRFENSEQGLFLETLRLRNFFLIAQLDMSDYRNSVKKQLVQIIVLSIVLLLVGIGGFFSMITLQGFKGTQRKLKTISEFTEILISSMPVGVIALDAKGIIQTCNRSAGYIMNIKPEKVLGKSHRTLFPEEIRRVLPGAGLRENGKNIVVDLELEGSNKVLDIEKVAIGSGYNDQRGEMLLIQDLTIQKKLEQELRRNERHAALGKVAAGVAHELRNPLSSIKGLATLLKTRLIKDGSSAETADVMISEVERLDRSIGELLDYARPKILEKKDVDIIGIIRKAILLIESDARETGVTVLENYRMKACTVQGEEDRLTQVFLNLFLNSIQAMPDGGMLEIDVNKIDGKVVIKITDSGIGIEKELLEKIFDPYFTTKTQGTGLGLSLTAKIIEDHDGRIAFKSEKGHGTEAEVSLPV